MKLLAAVSVAAFCVALFARGFEASALPGSLSAAVTAASLFHVLYRSVLWRWDPVLAAPDFTKVDRAVLEFRHAAESGGDRPAAEEGLRRKPAKVKVRQRACDVSMSMQTDEMSSAVLMGRFVREGGGRDVQDWLLLYVYRTHSDSLHAASNPDQFGACRAAFDTLLGHWVGDYWTNQLTRGRVHFCGMESVEGGTSVGVAGGREGTAMGKGAGDEDITLRKANVARQGGSEIREDMRSGHASSRESLLALNRNGMEWNGMEWNESYF